MLVVDAHPSADSLCASLAAAYVEEARSAGAPVRSLVLRDLAFDPILHQGYRAEQPLEPDLVDASEAILAARHLVFVYPTWWGTYPALLKGFLDRVLLPGFAFRFTGPAAWDKLLTGRSARLVVTLDWPVWAHHLIQGAPGRKAMARATLGFCGVGPVRATELSPAGRADERQREAFFARVRADARRDARGLPRAAIAPPVLVPGGSAR